MSETKGSPWSLENGLPEFTYIQFCLLIRQCNYYLRLVRPWRQGKGHHRPYASPPRGWLQYIFKAFQLGKVPARWLPARIWRHFLATDRYQTDTDHEDIVSPGIISKESEDELLQLLTVCDLSGRLGINGFG